MIRPWVAVTGLLALLVACTPDADETADTLPPAQEEPATGAGISVAVIVPSLDGLDSAMQAALEEDVEAVADWAGDGVDEVRAVPADASVFVADFAELMAERGTDLVCILGADAPSIIDRLEPRYSAVTFCSVRPAPPEDADPDGQPDDPPGTVHVRVEELGHLIGMAARGAAGTAPVGLVLGGDGLLDQHIRAGIEAGAGGGGPVVTAEGDEQSMADQVAELATLGAQAVVIDGGVGAVDAIHAAVDADIDVLAPAPVWAASLRQRGAALTWWVRWDLLLREPILGLLEDATDHQPLGTDADIFEVRPGDRAPESLRAILDVAIDELASGARDPLQAPIQSGVPTTQDLLDPPVDPRDAGAPGEDPEDEDDGDGNDGDGGDAAEDDDDDADRG